MTPTSSPAAAQTAVAAALSAVGRVVRGNPDAVKTVFAAALAGGHVLLEDVPGVGKTTLARSMAAVLGCRFSRVQFTADLLPSDVLGVQMLDAASGTLRFREGPVFSNVLLADEINRASPKTQSAMLEAMADKQVSVDNTSHPLPAPFWVIATQNPVEHHGAYPLPESQLDRFAVRVSLGYPPAEDERALLLSPGASEAQLKDTPAAFDPGAVLALQAHVRGVHLSAPVADYILALVRATREHPDVVLGCSPRGALAFAAMVRARAFVDGRDHVLPDDVQAMAEPVLGHRLALATTGGMGARAAAAAVVAGIVRDVPVPR